jgi:hypothetical protein
MSTKNVHGRLNNADFITGSNSTQNMDYKAKHIKILSTLNYFNLSRESTRLETFSLQENKNPSFYSFSPQIG